MSFPGRKVLSESDTGSLAALMDSGFTLSDAMKILENDENSDVFECIRDRLQNGEELRTFIAAFVPLSYGKYLPDFLRFLPVLESLQLTGEILRKQKEEQDRLLRGLGYPFLLMAGMSVGILLFNRLVLPAMTALMGSFQSADRSTFLLQKAAGIFSSLLFLAVCFTAAALAFLLSGKRIVRTYCFLSARRSGCLLVQYASRQFASIYLQCLQRRVSTRESIAIMKEMKGRPLPAFIAGELEKSFLSGASFADAVRSPYLESGLAGFFRLSLYTDNTEEMLKGYLSMCEKRTEMQIRRLTGVIRLISYAAAGIVIIAVYRILMMPMSLLQTLS